MGTWKLYEINGTQETLITAYTSNVLNQQFNNPKPIETKEYRISFTDNDGCTGSQTFTIPGCGCKFTVISGSSNKVLRWKSLDGTTEYGTAYTHSDGDSITLNSSITKVKAVFDPWTDPDTGAECRINSVEINCGETGNTGVVCDDCVVVPKKTYLYQCYGFENYPQAYKGFDLDFKCSLDGSFRCDDNYDGVIFTLSSQACSNNPLHVDWNAKIDEKTIAKIDYNLYPNHEHELSATTTNAMRNAIWQSNPHITTDSFEFSYGCGTHGYKKNLSFTKEIIDEIDDETVIRYTCTTNSNIYFEFSLVYVEAYTIISCTAHGLDQLEEP